MFFANPPFERENLFPLLRKSFFEVFYLIRILIMAGVFCDSNPLAHEGPGDNNRNTHLFLEQLQFRVLGRKCTVVCAQASHVDFTSVKKCDEVIQVGHADGQHGVGSCDSSLSMCGRDDCGG